MAEERKTELDNPVLTGEIPRPNTDELDDNANLMATVMNGEELAEKMKGYMDSHYVQNIHGKQYPKVEWWNTLGSFIGVKPMLEFDRRMDNGEVVEWEATIQLRHTGTNALHGRAASMCSSQERMWKSSDEYAIRSMASTRATGKAYRLGYSHIAIAAGLEPTPAEEMIGIEKSDRFERAPAKSAPTQQATSTATTPTNDWETYQRDGGNFVLPVGRQEYAKAGMTLTEVARTEKGRSWLDWMSKQTATPQRQVPKIAGDFLAKQHEFEKEVISVAKSDPMVKLNDSKLKALQLLKETGTDNSEWHDLIVAELGDKFKDGSDSYSQEDWEEIRVHFTRRAENSSQGELL